MDYRTTINLPQTSFPMKAGLKEKEPKILKEWEEKKVYEIIRGLRKNSPKFILHDGPPYANGDIHLGHAMNKILKDIIVRYKSIQGFDSPYIPGWDCHGMPIEFKVQESLGDKYKETPINIMRKKCRAYAQKHIDSQRKQFKRLGILGDFENPYLTMSPEFEAEIVSTFAKLVELGYIYKGLKSIHWCPNCETALAAAEIEYDENHSSRSIYVKFPVLNKIEKINGKKANVLIWTTTPWTLPANVACAFNEKLNYVAVELEGEYSIMASDLVESVFKKKDLNTENLKTTPLTIEEIKSLDVSHPFIGSRKSTVVFAEYVASDTGTGIVHTAPGHGTDDYNTGIKYKLDIYCPVDRQGKYTSDFPQMEGVSVTEANPKIIDILKNNKTLYFEEKVTHSYPICWRCKKPLIFRATDQWFMNMNYKDIDKKAIESLSSLRWHPKWGQERMKAMLTDRPDWCLSRQRAWGVPIPAFYCKKCGETLLTPESTKYVADIVRKKGIDVWFDLEAKELLPEGIKCKCGGNEFGKENDILDVWFDSGVSSFSLEKTHGLKFPVDVYLEGGDQYRGWFQSSLWPSMAIRGVPPYKQLITHGWTLDEQGRAMHKSLGNSVSPLDLIEKFGADILRLWCISEDSTHNFRLGDNMMQAVADNYRKIRNTFRYLLGNLNDFNTEKDTVKSNDLLPVDRYALSRLNSFLKYSEEKIDNYEYHLFYQRLLNYCAVELSATYLDIIKDRLYCDKKDSITRRSAQTVLYSILDSLVRLLSPFLPFTMEEIWKSYKGENANSIHLELLKKCDDTLLDTNIENEWVTLLKVRDDVLVALERARDNNTIGKSLEAAVSIFPKDDNTKNILAKYVKYLNEVFIVSKVVVVSKTEEASLEGALTNITVKMADDKKCVRCWGYYETVGKNTEHPELCERCADAVS